MKIFTLSTSLFAANQVIRVDKTIDSSYLHSSIGMRKVATVMPLESEHFMQPCLSDDGVWEGIG
ncbi:hypothetical protein BOTCAL_0667g00030 [Botryotinia calthae]|uniref:Uncharacterized protein n=1 Tax=Botryotinia calthae TaxID=38488 RepID=A0A4Y8CKB1_9HELO|nr:hypothetical protein BOTCAL_0667g00030 [Botryotinia calthae]